MLPSFANKCENASASTKDYIAGAGVPAEATGVLDVGDLCPMHL